MGAAAMLKASPRLVKAARALQEQMPHPQPVWQVTCLGNEYVVYIVTGTIQPQHCPACGGDARVETIVLNDGTA